MLLFSAYRSTGNNNNNNNNNSILYYLCAESTATRPITDTAQCNCIMDNYNQKSKRNYRQAQEETHINAEKYTNKQCK
jgi:hypothetical protein